MKILYAILFLIKKENEFLQITDLLILHFYSSYAHMIMN